VVYSGTAFAQSHLFKWGYNTRSELVTADRYQGTNPDSPGTQYPQYGDYEFAYDHIGNRLTYGVDANPDTTYAANDLNQYSGTTNPTEHLCYDDDGNLIRDGKASPTCPGTDGLREYKWDAENRLIEVAPVSPSNDPPRNKKVKFVYDYMGRRVRKEVFIYDDGWPQDNDPDEQWHFVYDGWNVVMVLDGLNSNATTRKYTWGLDLSGTIHGAGGIGGLLAAVETQGTSSELDDKRYWYFYDANGNVGQVLDATDTNNISIAARYEYDPYGNPIPIPQPPGPGPYADLNPFRFSTKWFDDETGLGYWGKRCYSSRLGRWISRDPIGEQGGLNLSEFARNSATNRTDPIGLASQGEEFHITVKPSTPRILENMFGDQTCGAYEVQWDFVADAYPCYYADFMYVMQKVDVFLDCHLGGTEHCKKTKNKEPKKPSATGRPDVTYYEMWRVEVGNGQAPILSVPDRSNFPPCPDCCGWAVQRGRVRAFCSFKGDRIDTAIRLWEESTNHKDKPVRTITCCSTKIDVNAGSLPYRKGGRPPGFWNDYQGGEATREASTAWNCSCSQKELQDPKGPRNKSQSWANP
jgi:RHS repeat-associated protein